VQRQALGPKPGERAEILREVLGEAFTDPKLKQFTWKNGKRFKMGLMLDEVSIDSSQIDLRFVTAESPPGLAKAVAETQAASRHKSMEEAIFWVFALTPELDELVAEVFRSRTMIAKYEQLRGQGKISPDESSCLANERSEAVRLGTKLRAELLKATASGTGIFQGESHDNAALGKDLPEILRSLLTKIVPLLYKSFDIGAIPLGSFEPGEILKAANLSGLPQAFYEAPFLLVTGQDGKWSVNVDAPAAQEILTFLKNRRELGERVEGKDLERKFMGSGFGWDVEVIRAIVALLLRAGAVEMTHQDRKFRNGQDLAARAPFTSAVAFRAAAFAPRETVDIKLLAAAASNLELITGQEVNAEETAIYLAFKAYAEDEEKSLLPVMARASALQLAQAAPLTEQLGKLRALRDSASDDCVKTLVNEGKSLAGSAKRAAGLRNVLTHGGLEALGRAKSILGSLAPLVPGGDAEAAAAAAALAVEVDAAEDLGKLKHASELADKVDASFGKAYESAHASRQAAIEALIDRLRGRLDWPVAPEHAEAIVAWLRSRGSHPAERGPGQLTCATCKAGLRQLESELSAMGGLETEAVLRLVELAAPPKALVKRVSARSLCAEALATREDVKDYVSRLENELMKLVDEGARVIVE